MISNNWQSPLAQGFNPMGNLWFFSAYPWLRQAFATPVSVPGYSTTSTVAQPAYRPTPAPYPSYPVSPVMPGPPPAPGPSILRPAVTMPGPYSVRIGRSASVMSPPTPAPPRLWKSGVTTTGGGISPKFAMPGPLMDFSDSGLAAMSETTKDLLLYAALAAGGFALYKVMKDGRKPRRETTTRMF